MCPFAAPAATRAVALAVAVAAAVPAAAQAPATVPTVLAAELVDAGQTLRAPEAPAVVVGRLPDGFPAVMLPAGARVLGGALWRTGNAAALLDVAGSPQDARARTLAALEASGWKAPPPVPDPQDAFGYPRFRSSVPAEADRDATRCAPGDSAGAIVVGARAREGRAIVRLLALPPARVGRCRPPQPARNVMAGRFRRPPMPGLAPPAGVRLQVEPSTEFGQYSSTANARVLPDSATGALPATAAVLAHYARALAAQGWTEAAVPGWDTTRATPLFASPADSTGARWIASVDARLDSTSRDAGAASRTAPPTAPATALALRLRVAQMGRAEPGNWRGGVAGSADVITGVGVGMMSSTTTVSGGVDGARARPRPAGPPVSRELVEALLGNTFFGTGAGRDTAERLTDGRPPAGWRAPIPNAPGARVLGGQRTGLEETGAFGGWLTLVATVPASPADAAAAYARQLDAAGWRPPPPALTRNPASSGFLSSPPPGRVARPRETVVTRCGPDGSDYLTGDASARRFGSGSLVRVTVLRASEGGPCSTGDRAALARSREMRAPVPVLAVPAGFVVQGEFGNGGPFEWHMAATVRGAASPAAVVGAYAAELRAAGWTVDSAAASYAVAAAPVRRTVPASVDSAAGAASGLDAVTSRMFAGPQE